MTNSTELPSAMITNTFVRQLDEALQFGPRERAAARAVDPFSWVVWSLSNLSGGECQLLPPFDDRERWTTDRSWDFLGRPLMHHGEKLIDLQRGDLALAVDELYASKKSEDVERFEHLSLAAAAYVFTMSKMPTADAQEIASFMPVIPQVYVHTKTANERQVVVRTETDPHTFALTEPPRNVLSFGPGITGPTLASELMVETEAVHFVSGGKGAHFVNRLTDCQISMTEAALSDYKRLRLPFPAPLPDGVDMSMLDMPKPQYYIDGMAAAAEQFPKDQQLDVALMTAVHSAGVEECTAGIALAADRLREGGVFVLKAPDVSLGNDAGMDVLAFPAMQAFGAPAVAGACSMVNIRPNNGPPVPCRASFAIYQKQ